MTKAHLLAEVPVLSQAAAEEERARHLDRAGHQSEERAGKAQTRQAQTLQQIQGQVVAVRQVAAHQVQGQAVSSIFG
jgi:hypothetical protein